MQVVIVLSSTVQIKPFSSFTCAAEAVITEISYADNSATRGEAGDNRGCALLITRAPSCRALAKAGFSLALAKAAAP